MHACIKGSVAVALIAALGGFAGNALATAPSGFYDTTTTYYADAAHTRVVGSVEYDCQGRRTLWGQQTNYSNYKSVECPDTGGSTGGGGGDGWPIGGCSLIYTPYPEYICG